MAITFSLPIGLEDVDGSVLVDDTVSSIKLIEVDTAAEIGGTLIDHGVYQFSSVISGDYEVYSGATKLTIFGVIKVGEKNAVMTSGTQTIAGAKTFSNQIILSSGVKTDTISENTSNTGVTIDGILLKDSLNTSGIMALSGNQTATGIKTFATVAMTQAGSNFNMAGWYITNLSDAVTGSGAATLSQVVTLIAAAEATPFQESPNKIRLIPGGSEKTGQVYTTYAAAMQYALAAAGVDHRMCIEIQGMGVAGYNYITINNSGGAYLDDYIHLKGINQDIVMIPPSNATVSVSTLGNSIIENVTMYADVMGDTLAFTNIIFKDVYFDLIATSVTFTNCEFRNCSIKVNDDDDATATFTTCKGASVTANQDFGSSPIKGWSSTPKADF